MVPDVIDNRDPHPLARAAAVRSASEQDPLTRAEVRRLTMGQRLRAGWALSRYASRLHPKLR